MNLENKYKERNPIETVSIIKQFFLNKNLIVKEREVIQSEESGVWSCYIQLYSNEHKFYQTCGKGTSKEFALASGYAELYERFCNKNYLFSQVFSYNFFLQENKIKNNYFLSSQEIEIDIKDLKNKLIYEHYISIFGNEENINDFLNFFCNNKIIEVPFTNCFNKNKIEYHDPRLWQKLMGSSGMAAGNTLEEALIQGISEIFEHYGQEQFFKNPPNILYEIDKKYLDIDNIALINNIKEKDKEIKFFDLSYNYNVPVCLGILYNKKTYNYLINFSSAPTLSIAIERVITELYQNKKNYNKVSIMPQAPYKSTSWEKELLKGYTRISNTNRIPEHLLINSIKTKPNNIFLEDNKYNNLNFLEHYEKICKNLGLKLYYYNRSNLNNIYSIQIISPYYKYRTFYSEYLNNISIQRKKELILMTKNIYDLIFNSFLNNFNDLKYYMNNLLNITQLNDEEIEFIMFMLGTNWFNPFFKRENLSAIFSLCNNNSNVKQLIEKFQNTDYEFYARKYLSLYQYKISNQYTDEEIYQIFSQLDEELIKEEIALCNNQEFLFYKIILESMKKAYSSSAFFNMIEAYCD